jgi:hypothetical protein
MTRNKRRNSSVASARHVVITSETRASYLVACGEEWRLKHGTKKKRRRICSGYLRGSTGREHPLRTCSLACSKVIERILHIVVTLCGSPSSSLYDAKYRKRKWLAKKAMFHKITIIGVKAAISSGSLYGIINETFLCAGERRVWRNVRSNLMTSNIEAS